MTRTVSRATPLGTGDQVTPSIATKVGEKQRREDSNANEDGEILVQTNLSVSDKNDEQLDPTGGDICSDVYLKGRAMCHQARPLLLWYATEG